MLSRRLQVVLLFLGVTQFINQQVFIQTVQAQGKQNRKETPNCSTALQAAKDKIKGRRNVTVKSIENFDVRDDYEDYPQDRPYGYKFILEGQATNSILNSTKLLRTISTDIIKNCESVSLVIIAENYSDNAESWGLLKNSKVELFTASTGCPNQPSRTFKKLRWGKLPCNP